MNIKSAKEMRENFYNEVSNFMNEIKSKTEREINDIYERDRGTYKIHLDLSDVSFGFLFKARKELKSYKKELEELGYKVKFRLAEDWRGYDCLRIIIKW